VQLQACPPPRDALLVNIQHPQQQVVAAAVWGASKHPHYRPLAAHVPWAPTVPRQAYQRSQAHAPLANIQHPRHQPVRFASPGSMQLQHHQSAQVAALEIFKIQWGKVYARHAPQEVFSPNLDQQNAQLAPRDRTAVREGWPQNQECAQPGALPTIHL